MFCKSVRGFLLGEDCEPGFRQTPQMGANYITTPNCCQKDYGSSCPGALKFFLSQYLRRNNACECTRIQSNQYEKDRD